ncbi:hypothetical protein GH865_11860 [Rhodocyclus tenuis]|uniref:hypothetical protein n=1 Tax=Rhodocyclus gracilis TaxID=2929842 RepID=UPI00129897A5|nr:hypothetical protein [Rhodocyclus gracilis]MRD73936.1 hypothetical protein [Rhodocyclus gracilis]
MSHAMYPLSLPSRSPFVRPTPAGVLWRNERLPVAARALPRPSRVGGVSGDRWVAVCSLLVLLLVVIDGGLR